MKKNLLQFICLSLFVFAGLRTSKAQCGFTGLNANYCTNSAPSTLTPGLTGGTFSGNGVSGNVFSPSVAGPGTHTINFSTCSSTYAVQQVTFSPLTSLGTAVSLTDDSESGALPIGFTFNFFCTPYTNFYISSNGFIEFALTGNGCCSGQALPNNSTPNNLIAATWTDMNPGTGGTITYTTIGTAPNRTLVVNYLGVYYYGTTIPATTQIRLAESSNLIEIHSTSLPGNGSGGIVTMGIENSGGTVGYAVPGRNAASWTATNDAWRFVPGTACNISQTTTVSPTSITVVGNNSICIGGTASLTATGNTTYTWSTVSNSNSISVSPTVNTTYSVSGTNSFGCIAGSAVTVTVDNTPTITAVNANSTTGTCPNTPVTLFGTGATSYSWTGNITNNVPFTTTVSNTYSVVGSNACGSTTAAISVSIHPLPPVTASVNNATICSGSSAILNGGGAVTYTWTGPTGTVPNNTAFSPTSSGNYTVRGTSVLGCTASAVAGITVLITPSVQPVATPTSVCLGVPAVLSSIGATSYNWLPGGSTTANVTVTPLGTTNYTLVRSNGPCSFTSNVTLVISPLPFANVSATPSIICAGDPVALNVFGGITYTWYPNGFTSSNFTLYPNNSVTYTVTSSNGSCTATGIQQVSVNPSPLVSINSSTTTVCAGGSVTLTATGNAATYTWLPGPGNNNSYVVNPTTISQYTLIGGNASNCTTQQTQLIIANPVPPLLLTSSLPYVCTGTTAVLSIANATLPGVTYSWSSNSGAGSTSNVSPTVSTTYFASAVTNSTGCSSSGSLALTVNISTFVVTSPTAICRGSSAVISAAGAANSYSWNVNGANTPSITVSPSLTTNYVVTGITGSCSSTQTVPLIVNLLPNVQATAVKSQICRLENGTLTATGANSYTWNTNANTQSIIINSLTVTSTFTVTGTDLNNCAKSNTVTQFVATCQGVEKLNNNESFGLSVYPNPNNGNFSISCGATITFDIINTLGQVVGTFDVLKDHKKEVIVNNLPNGVYVLSGASNGVKVNKKIVIDK